jgi:hypothetical protein
MSVLRRSLDAAKVGRSEKLDGFARLDRFVRNVEESAAPKANFRRALDHERAISPSIGGRTVSDDAKKRTARQLELF